MKKLVCLIASMMIAQSVSAGEMADYLIKAAFGIGAGYYAKSVSIKMDQIAGRPSTIDQAGYRARSRQANHAANVFFAAAFVIPATSWAARHVYLVRDEAGLSIAYRKKF